ncbi:MinD/ParA family ATP-binding protein [Rhodococcus globerulus]|uniref:AAA family ATPase n=1 Tax=Rhodococcus globerulus TaxID=33008 RepID=A0ABU4BV35_RHOGO|nr:AAA family ATPase [Rhodococcus globerulus]MDV6268090.1 AAA family ATPase [Rhodococcus globerulus]
MADKKDDAGAGIWEPVRPAPAPHQQAAPKPVHAPTPASPKDVDPGMRSLFVAPTDNTAPRPNGHDSVPMYPAPPTPPPATTAPPAASNPMPAPNSMPVPNSTPAPNAGRVPAIQYPGGPPGPANGHFASGPFAASLPPQTYEPSPGVGRTNGAGNPGAVNPVAAQQAPVPRPQFPAAPAPSGQMPPAARVPVSPPVPNPQMPNPQMPNPQMPVPRPPAAGPASIVGTQPAPGRPESSLPMSAQDLSNALLLKPVKPAPVGGWRKAVYTLSGRSLNLGNGAKDQQMLELTHKINQPMQGCYKVAVLSLKGGVGKTTTTATLGSTFASVRGDRVIAIDANPDRGTLSQKVPLETPATVRNLLRDEATIEKYSDVRGYTSQSRHRLEVLASDSDPAVSEAFSGEDYTRTVTMLEKFYSIVLTDCGTGLMHSAMTAVLEQADSLIVVSSGSVDGARSASATLDWLDAHGHSALVSNAVAVINAVRPGSGKVDLPRVVEHFEQRCRTVRLIPFDPHLEEGAEVDLDRLRSGTRDALFELAAAVADDFPRSHYGRPLQR